MSRNAWITIIIILLVIIIGWAVYASMQTSNNPTIDLNGTPAPADQSGTNSNTPVIVGGSSTTTVNSTTTVTTTNPTVRTFTVVGSNFAFNPSTITVNKGDTVKINFSSQDGSHDFVVDAFSARTPIISSGKTTSITFVANKSGSFEYYCSISNHRAMGMVGTLIVK